MVMTMLYAPGPGIFPVSFNSNAPPSRRSDEDKKGFDFDLAPLSTIASNESFLTYGVGGGLADSSGGSTMFHSDGAAKIKIGGNVRTRNI